MTTAITQCPCGSGRDYDHCCGLYIEGKAHAPTAEALMRSRYTAYALGKIDYIVASCTKTDGIDIDATRRWSEGAQWLGLHIHGTEKGNEGDTEGRVDFTASYILDGMREKHRENAQFIKKDGRWFFDEGDVKMQTIVRATPKVGRNDPCPCGSGKKYKKCCAAGHDSAGNGADSPGSGAGGGNSGSGPLIDSGSGAAP